MIRPYRLSVEKNYILNWLRGFHSVEYDVVDRMKDHLCIIRVECLTLRGDWEGGKPERILLPLHLTAHKDQGLLSDIPGFFGFFIFPSEFYYDSLSRHFRLFSPQF